MAEQELTYAEVFHLLYGTMCRYAQTKHGLDQMTAEQLAADAMYALQNIFREFNPKTLPALSVWLFRTTRFKVMEHNHRLHHRVIHMNDEDPKYRDACDPEDVVEQILQTELLNELVATIKRRLSTSDQELFDDVFLNKLSTEEIVKKYDINESTYYSKKSRLRARVQKIVREDWEK